MKLEGVLEAVWSDLDKMNESGDAYIYSVVEVDADGNRLVLEDYEKTENLSRIHILQAVSFSSRIFCPSMLNTCG